MNDLPSCGVFSKTRMYADDTTVTSAAEDPDTLQVKMNSDLNKIQTWLKVNKLTLNVKKTKYMLIGSRPKLGLVSFINPLESRLMKISHGKLILKKFQRRY